MAEGATVGLARLRRRDAAGGRLYMGEVCEGGVCKGRGWGKVSFGGVGRKG